MNYKKLTSKDYFKSLRIIHFALILGLLLYTSIVIFLFESGSLKKDDSLTNPFWMVILVMVLFGIIGNRIIFNNKLKALKKTPILAEKIEGYRAALISKFALFEGPALFSIVIYQLTGNLIFLGFTGLMIGVFLLNKPTISKTCLDLELNNEDANKLNDPEAIIAEILIRR